MQKGPLSRAFRSIGSSYLFCREQRRTFAWSVMEPMGSTEIEWTAIRLKTDLTLQTNPNKTKGSSNQIAI